MGFCCTILSMPPCRYLHRLTNQKIVLFPNFLLLEPLGVEVGIDGFLAPGIAGTSGTVLGTRGLKALEC